MHELGVTFHVMDSIEEIAKENNVDQINKVVLELGEVSTVIDDYLYDCWKWASTKRTLFNNSTLVIEKLEAITYCEDCKETYRTIEYGKTCPNCGSEHTYLVQGNEFNIKEIEVLDS